MLISVVRRKQARRERPSLRTYVANAGRFYAHKERQNIPVTFGPSGKAKEE